MSAGFPLLRATVALLLGLLCACGAEVERSGKAATAAPVAVVLHTVESREWVEGIEALGTAHANESVTLTAKVTETVDRVNFEDGGFATLGQVLVDLSGRAEVAALEEAQASYTEALQQYQRQVDLVSNGTLPAGTIDRLVAARDAAKARMQAIRARLADRVITAPFAGVLGFRMVSPGTLVTPGTEITTLDDISVIKLDFSVPEHFLSALRIGQQVAARSAAWPERSFIGEVRTIGSRVDAVTRAVTVRAEVPNPEALLRPGMLLTLNLQRAPRQALTLPEIALIQVGNQQSVFRVDAEGKAQRVAVKTGARRAGEVEILEGLDVGDRVVLEGVVKLRPGASVTEQPTQSTATNAPIAGPKT